MDGGDDKLLADLSTQDGASQRRVGEDTAAHDMTSSAMDLTHQDDIPQKLEHDNLEKLPQDAALDLGDQQQKHDQQQPQDLAVDIQPLPNQEQDQESQDNAKDTERDGDDEELEGDDNSSSDGSSSSDDSASSTHKTPSSSDSDKDDMAGTKFGIPRFTGQETCAEHYC